jgi:hypothetical protein
MATRYKSNTEVPGRLSTGYEGESSDSDFIPSLKIEDVDRAFFELFQSSLPLFYRSSKNSDGEQKRIPVIFSTGERFAIATKKEPVRDKNGALILPLISITRSGISQENSKGGGINDRQNELIIKRKISKEDPLYQSTQKTSNDFFESSGRVFYPRLEKGIYETIVIPMPKYFTLSYEVTIWTQYLQQMNDVMQVMMGSYLQPGARNIKIDTKQGYWLVAYFGDEVSQDSNVSDFSDSERLLKASFTASVPAYLILPEFPGSMKPIKKFISAPEITFNSVPKQEIEDIPGPGIPPGNIDAYLLSEVSTIDDPDFPDSIGVSGKVQSKRLTGDITNTIPQYPLGSRKTSKQETEIFELNQDPYTGEKKRIRVKKTRTNSQGESVLLASEFNSKKK